MTVYRKDYCAPHFSLRSIDLEFELDPSRTRVLNKMSLDVFEEKPICFNGDDLEFFSLRVNGQDVKPDFVDQNFYLNLGKGLVDVEIINFIHPSKNETNMGLYLCDDRYVTQCEPEGFRRITYSIDRPDVLSVYKVKVTGNFPHLLSNGNLIEAGTNENGIPYAIWLDPHPKPTYLFALVAGDFEVLKKEIRTPAGIKVGLELYLENGKKDQGHFALKAMEDAIVWDETTFDRKYDLEKYIIVAISKFNAGAMENKGLNIFNDRFVLAREDLATDDEFEDIEAVIGHEYFHNWSGNRVTCRDWFQLSLKEGLTVYRDQRFSEDLRSRTHHRLKAIQFLKNVQFLEDQGSMRHPIRPESYETIDNFYTATIYEKGAELIRMIAESIGLDQFKIGLNHYFEKFDGKAVTCDDFVDAISEGSGVELEHFKKWYSSVGTPILRTKIEGSKFFLESSHDVPVPLDLKIFDRDSNESFSIKEVLKEQKKSFDIPNFKNPILSFNRNFIAPILLQSESTLDDLMFLVQKEEDAYIRIDALETILKKCFIEKKEIPKDFFESLIDVVSKEKDERAKGKFLVSPGISENLVLVERDFNVENFSKFKKDFLHGYHSDPRRVQFLENEFERVKKWTKDPQGSRSYQNRLLQILSLKDHSKALLQVKNSRNMTERLGAMVALNSFDSEERKEAFNDFYHRFKSENLVIYNGYRLEGMLEDENLLLNLKRIQNDGIFNWNIPNAIYSLFQGYFKNPMGFLKEKKENTDFIVEAVLFLDQKNPKVASRLAKGFSNSKKFSAGLKRIHFEALEHLALNAKSVDVLEIVQSTLKELK